MFKFPSLALTCLNSQYLAQTRHSLVDTISPRRCQKIRISNLSKIIIFKENRVFTSKKYVIDPSHPSRMSNNLCNKGISQLKSGWSFSYLTLSSLGLTTKLSLKLPETPWTCTNKLPNKKASMLSMAKFPQTWGHRVLKIPHWLFVFRSTK